MKNSDVLRDVKNMVVAIGIAEKDTWKPLGFAGTGFFISSDGYLVSAAHVFQACEEYVNANGNLKRVIFTINNSTNQFNIVPFAWGRIRIPTPPAPYVGPGNLDMGIGKVPGNNIFFLELKEDKSELYEEIITCGYPNPSTSLTIFEKMDEYSGIRRSPVTQFGHISAFLPYDNYKKPYGIQTDIIGTGGSSGSPIISLNDRKVIGLTQQVIPAEVDVKIHNVPAMAKIGLMFGLTSGIIKQCYEAARKSREKGETMHTFDLELPGSVDRVTYNIPPSNDSQKSLKPSGP